jgi:RecA-family ATPase
MLLGPLWHEGELCILTADTNIGKSTLAVQIADNISKGIGSKYLPFTAKPQDVIYGDFEFGYKQFENRYSDNYQNHYKFSNRLYRLEINQNFSQITDLNEKLLLDLEKLIVKTGAKVVIIDNLTYLRTQSMDTAKEALPLMQQLKALKTKYGLSILVLGHTPKRSMYSPLTRNDIAGSKHLANFADSIFAIGESATDKSSRYIKQLKARATEIVFNEDNVLECNIIKDHNCLKFEFTGTGNERDHLKSEPQTAELEQRVLEIRKLKPYASLRDIAAELGTNQVRVKRILDRNKHKFEP